MNVSLRQVRVALVILGAVVVAVLLNRFIMTDKKRIERTVQQMAVAVSKGDVDALFTHISADYHDETLSRTALKSMATAVFAKFDHVNPKIQRITVNVSGTLAHVEVSVSGSVESGGYQFPTGASDWAAEFRKEVGGTWRVTTIAPLRIGGNEVSGWHDVTREVY